MGPEKADFYTPRIALRELIVTKGIFSGSNVTNGIEHFIWSKKPYFV